MIFIEASVIGYRSFWFHCLFLFPYCFDCSTHVRCRSSWLFMSLYIAFLTGFDFRQIRNGVDRSIAKKSLQLDFATRHRLFRRPPQQHRCTLHSTGKWRFARARLHWRSCGHIAQKLLLAWWVLLFALYSKLIYEVH